MNHPTLATDIKCTGCMACVDACPTKALSSIYNEEGHLSYHCDTSKCILCHQCERACPVVSNFEYRLNGESTFYAAWCKDDAIRAKSSSGGAFAAMAACIIDRDGYVVGASNEGVCDIRHIVINNINDLHKLQGSKYTQSDANGIYKATLNLLREGNLVLFSGTGCQVAGLLSFLKRKKYSGQLITVDLVCGGVPSHLLIDKFIINEPYAVRKVVSFRSKENGWRSQGFVYNMKVEDEKGKIHDYTGIKNLITDGFSREMTERYSCYNCGFNGSHRASDFTIGDLWGDEDYKEQHAKGLSLVIAHNEMAKSLLENMHDYLTISPADKVKAISHNPRIVDGFNVRQYLFERKHLSYMFTHLPYKTLKHIYANDINKYSPWIFYKIWRKVRIEVLKSITNKGKDNKWIKDSSKQNGGGTMA